MKPTLLNHYPEKVQLGVNHQGEAVFLLRPSWDCGWYWSFGYVNTEDTHTHLDRLGDSNMVDNLKDYLAQMTLDDKDLWIFCELAVTIYTLKSMAELLHLGGSHYTHNPCYDILIQPDWLHHINHVLIPTLIDELYKVIL